MIEILEEQGSFEAILVNRHKVEQEHNPAISHVDDIILKNGPRAFKVAHLWTIVHPDTRAFHHHELRFEQYSRARGVWRHLVDRSITLDGDEQIAQLCTFLHAMHGLPDGTDHYAIVRAPDGTTNLPDLTRLLVGVSKQDIANLIATLLERTRNDAESLRLLVEKLADDADASQETVAALNVARFKKAVDKLETLIEANAREAEFQALLEANPWMLGSEYSGRLERRRWTRDEIQDLMVRRTVDGYLELIELKTPLGGKPLFGYDESHTCPYPGKDIMLVLGQVIHYLAELDPAQNEILRRDGEHVFKACAKIIIGRDGDEKQVAALRHFNGHIHRIEILTYDQLLHLARAVLWQAERVLQHDEELTDASPVPTIGAGPSSKPQDRAS